MRSLEDFAKVNNLLDALGVHELPMGLYYTDEEPQDAVSPKPGRLPSVETEARGEVNWPELNKNFSCVLGQLWIARKRQCAAYFDREHFGCLGGAFYLGFLKPQLDTIAHYVSTGIPGVLEGERFLESPEITRKFFETVDPRPAPARYCVFKPLDQFASSEDPELVIFFARPEVMGGLLGLATFVTNDFEAVSTPFGSGCSQLVSWPFKFIRDGKPKAVMGAWDPADRKFLKTDEITFTVSLGMFLSMVDRWPESFIQTGSWNTVKKRIAKSRRAWGEE
ncbi:DUF169 domain-containing protein [Thermodesulfobacteriota bacterium]